MPRQRLSFPGPTGATLSGELDLPDGPARGAGVFTPCFTCNKNYKGPRRIGAALAEAGWAVLRFDPTGLGQSGGDFRRTTLSTEVGDLLAAAAALAAGGRPATFLVGHSLGGAASLIAAGRLPTVRAVVTLGTPGSTGLLHRHLTAIRRPADDGPVADAPAGAVPGGAAAGPLWTVAVGGVDFTLAQSFWDDLLTHDVPAAVAALGRPYLIVQPTDDETVPPGEAEALFAAARPPRSLVSVPDVGHLVAREPADADRVAGIIAAWLAATLRV